MTASAGVWTHVVATYDAANGNVMALYVDGVLGNDLRVDVDRGIPHPGLVRAPLIQQGERLLQELLHLPLGSVRAGKIGRGKAPPNRSGSAAQTRSTRSHRSKTVPAF